ncbi:MAG: response regulator transcription factor [Anaerolineales bacterium]|nr:response regulator transcription factor [Anaerolineales bacterium]
MKALIVDDDRVLADVIAFTLRREGFEVIQAFDGTAALKRWTQDQPDIVVLDVNLPAMSGFEVCRQIREKANTPIVLLTVRGEEEDIVQGLNIGADDYIVKPFSPRQLVARIRAVLRRAGQISISNVLQVGNLKFIPNQRKVILGESEPILLTYLENRLLDYLMVNSGRVLETESIIDHIWGPSSADRDMLRQLIRRLRIKIEADPANPFYIRTVPGLGYGFIEDTETE